MSTHMLVCSSERSVAPFCIDQDLINLFGCSYLLRCQCYLVTGPFFNIRGLP